MNSRGTLQRRMRTQPNAVSLSSKQRRADTVTSMGEAMKQEYDFSKGVRGKFSRHDAQFNSPVYLDADVQAYLAAKAAQKGIPLSALVNELLQRDIALIELAK